MKKPQRYRRLMPTIIEAAELEDGDSPINGQGQRLYFLPGDIMILGPGADNYVMPQDLFRTLYEWIGDGQNERPQQH